MTRDKLLLPHPVLRPGGGLDYNESCNFGLEIKPGASRRTSEGVVEIKASFTLVSPTLEEMVKEGKAQYLVLATCAKTYYRLATSFDVQQILLEFPVKNLAGTLRLTPYIVTTKEIEWFIAPEHDPEIKIFQGFGKIPPGSILAIGAPHEIEMEQIGTVMSAIKLVPNANIMEGRYTINDEGDFIMIELNNKTYTDIARMRTHIKNLLYPSIYQAAIEYALRKATEEADSKWAKALQKTLEEHGLSNDNIEEKANEYAQIIMGDPLGQMLEWCNRSVSFD